ncbi:MAG: hypothetical protein AB7U20_18480 [Planctomycetaceae bacterium]
MNVQHAFQGGLVAALVTLGTNFGLDRAFAAPPVPADADAGVQILTRGPVHEAFAETVTYDPEPGIVVPKTPPAAIEELPPEHKPEGTNVAWIPGYWAWDDDSSDFLWVSGIWRALPPGRQWVSGYWTESGQRAQWTSGYWADARLTEAEYLPEPPASVETGPNIAAPSADYIWLPGSWVWQQNRYAWRPGFWSPVQQNWVWTPAHYQWAPRGYVYVDGYWDYAVDRRGVLFAPVSFSQNIYSQRGFSYTPTAVIDLAVFANHLFLRPNYGHYYYGDYYGANYTNAGFYPWYSFNSSRYGYDPIYSYQRWNHRQDRDWERRVQSDFENRRDHEEARPPRTLTAQQELLRKGLKEQDRGRVFAQPLERYTKAQDGPVRFQPLNTDDRQRFGRQGLDVRTHREARQKLETQTVPPTAGRPVRASEPARIPLPRSPVVAPPADQLGREFAPPKTHQFPQPDPNVVPKPRQPRGRPEARGNPNLIKPQENPQGQPKGRSGGKPQGGSKDKPSK